MDIESWLDGYDRRKHDLLGWLRDGGDSVSGARDMVPDLEKILGSIRARAQADAAAADLDRLDAVLDREVAMVDPAPAAPPLGAGPEVEAAASPAAAEGILKSLSWMDSHTPENTPPPATRSRTAARPAALDFLGTPATPGGAEAEPRVEELVTPAPATPEPAPVTPPPIESQPQADALPRTPPFEASPDFEPSPMVPRDALWKAPGNTDGAAASPSTSPGADHILSSATLEPAPPAAPRQPQRPIVIDCPEGEERRAALEGVGAGPDCPFLLHAVVEIPRGGGTGYVYNDPKDVFVVVDHPGPDTAPALDHVAYGFVPDSVSDDGAHLDTFVLSSGAAGPGEMLRVRPLGYLRRADGDHKLFCVPEKHRAQVMADIPDTTLKACETWRNPTGVSGGTWCDGGKARELIRRCVIA